MLTDTVDVINVLSVLEEATVHQWDETNEDEVQEDFYWRQAFDAPSGELSVSHFHGPWRLEVWQCGI